MHQKSQPVYDPPHLKNGKRWVKFPSLNQLYQDAGGGTASPQTSLTAKCPIKDLWGHTDVDHIGEGPSTPSSSKVRRLVFDHESPSPLPLDHSGPEAEQGDELVTVQGKQPQRGGKSPRKV
ncbi:hypothetical protein V8E54_008300 [Elaphomyces granulatus]